MMINGTWYENITCPNCKRRHPAHIACGTAGQIAAAAAEARGVTRRDCIEADETGEIAELRRQLDEAQRLAELRDESNKALCKLVEEARGYLADHRRQLAEVTQQRDTALATLGQVQAAATEVMAAADALLRERDGYRAACALADALRNKERGS